MVKLRAAAALVGLISFMAFAFWAPGAVSAEAPTRASGPLVDLQLASADPTDGAAGRVQVTEHAGGTTVTMTLTGLDSGAAGAVHGAHVHVGSCVAGNGAAAGAHFNAGGGVSAQTEVWLDFTVYGGGVASAVANVPFHIPDGGAASVVIHALPTDGSGAAGARLACLGVAL